MAEPLTLHIQFDQGVGQLEMGLDHPLVAPIRLALGSGSPPGKWIWFLLRDPRSNAYKVVGSFVHTPGNRLLYFPGASMQIDASFLREGTSRRNLDHLTLDPPLPNGRQASHVAAAPQREEKSRGLNFSSLPPADSMFPWFSLLVQDLSGFATMPADARITFPPPRPDVDSFGKSLLHGPVAVTATSPVGHEDSYFQMDVWVGRSTEWKSLKCRPIAWAYKSEIVSNAPKDEQTVHVAQQVIEFDASNGLSVLCSRPQGEVKHPCILRPTLKW